MQVRPVSELLEELDAAMDSAQGTGADISEAMALRHLAKAHLLSYHEVEAIEAIELAMNRTDEAHRRRIDKLLEEARTVLGQAGGQGADLDDARRHIANAEDALDASDYEAAIWLMNKAVQSMGDGVRTRTEALGSLARNQWLFEQLQRFEPVPDALVEVLDAQEDLVARGEYGESLSITGELLTGLENRLARHIEGLLAESKVHANDLKRVGLRAEAKRARKGYKRAHRSTRGKDTQTAIKILMELEREHSEAMERSRLLPGVG